MKPWLKFLLIVFVIVALGVFLTPVLYQFLPFKFDRIFRRIIMIGTLVAVVRFVRLRGDTLKRFGLKWEGKESLYFIGMGFLTGFVTLFLLVMVKMSLGIAHWAPENLSWLAILFKTGYFLAAAFLIALIEEFFFRGFLFRFFQDRFSLNVVASILLTSLIYSLVHFMNYSKPILAADPGLRDSFLLVLMPFLSFQSIAFFWREALGLFFLGVALNGVVLKARSLYPAIGLHAGCVFFVKTDGLFVDFSNANVLLYSSEKMYDGGLGWLFLLGMGWILTKTLRTPLTER